MVIDPPVEQG